MRLVGRLHRAVLLSASIIERSRRSIESSQTAIEIANLQRKDAIRRGQQATAASAVPWLVPDVLGVRDVSERAVPSVIAPAAWALATSECLLHAPLADRHDPRDDVRILAERLVASAEQRGHPVFDALIEDLAAAAARAPVDEAGLAKLETQILQLAEAVRAAVTAVKHGL